MEKKDQSPPSPRTTRSCGTSCVSTTANASVRWRKRASRKSPPCCKPARQRWAGWRQGDLHLFIYFTLELARYDLRAVTDVIGSTSSVVPLFVERSRRRVDSI